jgi:hypothetical protein
MSHDIVFNELYGSNYRQIQSFTGNNSPIKGQNRKTMPIPGVAMVKGVDQVVQANVETEGTSNAEYEEKITQLEKHIRKQKNHHGKKHVENQMKISFKDSQIKMLEAKIAQMEKDLLERSPEKRIEAEKEMSPEKVP